MPDLLEDDIRATAPRPDDAFVARLEARVEAGFPKDRRPAAAPKPARGSRRRALPLWTPGVALALCALLALVVAGGALRDDGGDMAAPLSGTYESSDGGSGAADAPEPGPSATESAGKAAPDRASGIAPGTTARQVERTTALELRTPEDEFGEVTAGVLRIADATGTIVQRSDVSERDGTGYATYDLRVPASRLDEALRRLSELGDVQSRTSSANDITGPYVSARDRLEDARDERRALLGALERADTERERDTLRARLRVVRAQIAAARADVERLRARANRAKVSVTVRSTGESGAWTPGDAWDDATRILEVAAGVALVAAAIGVPLVLLLAAAVAAGRAARRRRRNAVLG